MEGLSDRTNILLITSDQQHWDTLSCQGSEVNTPNLDRLAARGTLYQRAYCPNPTCTPTRASIITGKYPSQHGAYSLGTKLLESEHTVGEDFMAAGYRTAIVGKAHFQPLHGTDEFPSLEAYPILQDLDFWRSFDDPFYGFEHVELARNHTDEAHVGQHYAIWMEEKGLTNWKDYFRPPPPATTQTRSARGSFRRSSTTAAGSPSARARSSISTRRMMKRSSCGRVFSILIQSISCRNHGIPCTIPNR